MKFRSILLLLSLGYALFSKVYAQDVPPQKEGSIFSLEVGNLIFKVDSTYGAKVSSLTIDGSEFLVTSDVSPGFLWGSTLWPAPQNEWSWDNDNKYIWDNQEYEASIDGNIMSFKGQDASIDNGDSFHFLKSFSADSKDTTITMNYSMVNTTGKSIKKALWELTRVPVGGLTFWPTGPGGTWGGLAEATEENKGHTWYDRSKDDHMNTKFFADGKDGWLAHVDDKNRLFIKTFTDVDEADFADGEGEIELWVANKYIELENLSACEHISDKGKLNYDVKWYLRNLPSYVDVHVGSENLIAYVNWILTGKDKPEPPPVTITQNTTLPKVGIYPNPAKDYLRLQNFPENQEKVNLTLYDLTGKIRLVENISRSQEIDISKLESGIYFYRMQINSQLVQGKLIKQ